MSDDLISRHAAIRWVKTECNPYGKPTLDFESGKRVIGHLGQMPSADRPQGEWLEVNSWEAEHHSVTDMRCSICGKYANIVLPHKTRCVYDFCPNCGADMRKEEIEKENRL